MTDPREFPLPHPTSLEQVHAILDAAREHAPALLDPANYPGFTPDSSVDELPSVDALAAATDEGIVSWALERRVALAQRHPTWFLEFSSEELAAWRAEPDRMPLIARFRLAGELKMLNPPWTPLADQLQARAQSRAARQSLAIREILCTEFGQAARDAYFRTELAGFSAIAYRVHRDLDPDRSLEAMLAEVRPRVRRLTSAEPFPRARGERRP